MVLTHWMPAPEVAPSPVSEQPGYASSGSTPSVSSSSASKSDDTTDDDNSDASGSESINGEAVTAAGRIVITLFAPDLEAVRLDHWSIRSLVKHPVPEPDLVNHPLPIPRPISLAELGDIPLTAGMMILPPMASSKRGLSLFSLLSDIGNVRNRRHPQCIFHV